MSTLLTTSFVQMETFVEVARACFRQLSIVPEPTGNHCANDANALDIPDQPTRKKSDIRMN